MRRTWDGSVLCLCKVFAFLALHAKPCQGKDAHVHYVKGIAYKFASQEHLERFQAEPQKYLPQYGGYCAYAMSPKKADKTAGQ